MEENKVIELEVKKEGFFKRTHDKMSKWWTESGKATVKMIGKIALGVLATSAGVLAATAFANHLKETDEEQEDTIETEDYTVVDDTPVEE